MAQTRRIHRGNGACETSDGLVAAMLEPAFYPNPPESVTHKETHISHLFFVGELVYKIKKNVRFPFLDYSTLAKRRFFLNEELRLNRRLSPSVYLAVMPIAHDASGWRLGGWGPPAEYTLIMRRLPDRRMLPFLLESGQLTPEMMRALAEVLAPFHMSATPAALDAVQYPSMVEGQWRDNLAELRGLTRRLLDAENLAALTGFGNEFIHENRELFMRRAGQGWIRDVHGDLHCEHVCFAPEGIQIFDAIEFDPKLRCCDLASEIAFLIMDLQVRQGGHLVAPFLTRYLELIEDKEAPTLLPFYQCYRALVRGKVEALRSNRASASRYFRFAVRVSWDPLKPFLIIVSGLTGSGKSTLARELGVRLGMGVISSDVVRKALAGNFSSQVVPFNEGIYSPEMTEQTYAAMAKGAEQQVLSGAGAILDATFSQKSHRERIVRLADKYKIPLFIIRCFANEETIRARLEKRSKTGIDISDGRWEIYLRQRDAEQPMEQYPTVPRLDLDTGASLEELARRCERFIRLETSKRRP